MRTYESVKNFIEVETNSGCKLISTEYIRDKEYLDIECECGKPFRATFDRFRSDNQRKCKDCTWKIKNKQYKWNNYTQNDFINIVKLKALELGRIPKQDDFGKNNNLPSFSNIRTKLNVKTWNEVLQLCEVGNAKEKHYDEDKALQKLKSYIESLGYVPTRNALQEIPFQPSMTWFGNKFGSYENALQKIGYTRITTDNELLDILRNFKNKNRRSPTTKDMINSNGLPSTESYYERFNTFSWNEILELAGLELNHFQGYTKEYALEKLKEYYNTYNKVLTREEHRKYNLEPAHDWYCKYFGSYEQACFEAGLIDKPLTDDERISISIEELIKLANQLNRCPTVEEYESIKHKGFQRRTLEDKLHIKYNDLCVKQIPQHVKFYLDNNGEICRSLVELNISNFLITNKVKYEKETYYTEILGFMGRRRFDWKIYIGENIYYVEYFGLFYKNPKRSIDVEYLKNAKYKIKKLYQYGFADKCLFIFPSDIKTKSLEEIFSQIGLKVIDKVA